jgi:diaminopimelate decarboxylase/aspartate kinase
MSTQQDEPNELGQASYSSSDWVVLKFGGTSVASKARWETIAEQIRQRREQGERVFVVCSALSKVSNLLESLLKQVTNGEDASEQLQQLTQRHTQFAADMGLSADEFIGDILEDIERLVEGASLIGGLTDELRARIMSCGELMSTRLGAAWLREQGLDAHWRDAREMLVAMPAPIEASQSRRYLSATCRYEPDEVLLSKLDDEGQNIVVTQGFIASDDHEKTVLLGRGGSDTSAAYFAGRLRARRLEIWTDVPGMFTTNPKDRPDARLLRHVSYEEAQVLAAMGARVLHPRCIPPVRDLGIPLHIRCTPEPGMEGTVISAEADDEETSIKAVSTRHKLMLVRLRCPGHWHLAGLLAEVTHVFKRHGLSIDLISNSPQLISITLDPAVSPLGPIERANLVRDLEEFGETEFHEVVGSVSLVGSNIGMVLPKLSGGLEAMAAKRILMVSQASGDDGLSFVLRPEDVDAVMNPLHDWLVGSSIPESVFGPSWETLCKQHPAMLGD